MKNIMKNCTVLLLSFALIQSAMPFGVYAEETEEQKIAEIETAGDEIAGSAEEEILLPQNTETQESFDDEETEAGLLPPEANVNAGLSVSYSSDSAQFVSPHESAELSVNAYSAVGGLKYQWSYYDDEAHTYKDISGAVTDSYTVKDVVYRTLYRCTVTDASSSRSELGFTVIVQNRLEVSYVTSNTVYTEYGKSAKLEARVNAKDKTGMTMSWQDYYGNVLAEGTAVCNVPNVTEYRNLIFFVTDRYGNIESLYYQAAVENGLNGYFEPERQFARSGMNITLTPVINAANKANMTYEWGAYEYDFEGNVIGSYPIKGNGTSASVTVGNNDLEVTCHVQDSYGNNIWFSKRLIAVPDSGIRLLYREKYVKINESGSIDYQANGGKRPTWLNNHSSVLSLDGSKYTGLKAGSARVIVTNQNASDYCDFTVMFNDVQSSSKYYFDSVYWALRNNITTGVSDQKFSPESKCTREQVVTFLWRLAGMPEPTKEISFSDVKKSAYYYKAVAWAAEKGITTGVSSTKFGVGQPCTREQVVTFLYRTAGSPEVHYHGFFDDNTKGKYYYDAIGWAMYNGVTTGVSAFKFGVGSTCTRGMIVTFLDRYTNPLYGG